MRILTDNQELMLENVCSYIFETEKEDFEENPSDNHVYYLALELTIGQDEAYKELKQAILNSKE